MHEREVRKLHMKKYRDEAGLFLVEGRANVIELLNSSFPCEALFVTPEHEAETRRLLTPPHERTPLTVVPEDKLAHLGTLESNNAMLAVVPYFPLINSDEVYARATTDFCIVLDDVRDPGNLGTIMRTADWFGVSTIVVSPTTVDRYNPKVVSASKGSFLRVDIIETPLVPFLSRARNEGVTTYGTFLTGTQLHETGIRTSGLIVLGNEARGISSDIEALIDTRITIPKYGGAESLNVGVAAGIVLHALVKH